LEISSSTKTKIVQLILIVITGSLSGGIFSVFFQKIFQRPLIFNFFLGFAIGLQISFICTFFEFFIFEKRLRKLNFSVILFIKTSFYVFVIIISMMLISFLFFGSEILDKEPTARYSNLFTITLIFSILMSLYMNFVLSVNRMLGQRVLFSFFSGKYHKPIEEERIFMFLDLVSSTTIAEKIGHIKFHKFLNNFFFDITESIIESKGEIYKYVGDEVIVAWRLKEGILNANCIECFFRIEDDIEKYSNRYINDFGFIPEFRAGLHCGVVVSGEMGDFKKEIAFLGDVVNTTARIQNECNTKNKKLLISGDLLKLASLPSYVRSESLGEIKLRGKEEKIELFRLERI